MARLSGKTAIVTGGASGFGAGIVRKFVAEGARVMIADINGDGAQALAKELAETREAAQSREHDYAVIADEIDAWRTQISDIQAERDKLLRERDHAMRQVTQLSTDLDALRHERDGAIADRESLDEAMRQSGQALSVLRDELPRRAAAETMVARERDGLQTALRAAQERITALEAMVGERSSYIAELVQRHNALASRLNDLDKRVLVRAAVRLGGKSKRDDQA